MAPPAAKQGDRVTALDTHLIQPPGTSPPALTCNDPVDLPAGTVVAAGTVRIGG